MIILGFAVKAYLVSLCKSCFTSVVLKKMYQPELSSNMPFVWRLLFFVAALELSFLPCQSSLRFKKLTSIACNKAIW